MSRIHLTDRSSIALQFKQPAQSVEMKPSGLWYGFGDSWIKWCAENDYETGKNAFRIDLDDSELLVVGRDMSMEEFDRKYSGAAFPGSLLRHSSIDWPAVARRYAGIEIPRYSWRHRMEFSWYYGWDCASGCVWGDRAVKAAERIGSVEAI